ncbi:MAG: TetR/AcrR family transcriptional regulator [Myxococcota bacterium]
MSAEPETTRERILRRVTERLARSGLAGTGLRDLASAAGVSHRTLLYHFGSRDALVLEALRELRDYQYGLVADVFGNPEARPDSTDLARGVWKNITASDADDWFKLFYEAYVAALRDPESHSEFLDGVVHRWTSLIETLHAEDRPHLAGSESPTLLLAAIRGLHLDLLATGDRERVERALETLLRLFDRPPRVPPDVAE